MNDSSFSDILREVQAGKRALITVSNAYGGAMAICSLVQPALKDAFTGSGEANQGMAPAPVLREMLKRRDVIYQAYELFQVIADSMATIDEATASVGGNFDSITELLTGKQNQEAKHD